MQGEIESVEIVISSGRSCGSDAWTARFYTKFRACLHSCQAPSYHKIFPPLNAEVLRSYPSDIWGSFWHLPWLAGKFYGKLLLEHCEDKPLILLPSMPVDATLYFYLHLVVLLRGDEAPLQQYPVIVEQPNLPCDLFCWMRCKHIASSFSYIPVIIYGWFSQKIGFYRHDWHNSVFIIILSACISKHTRRLYHAPICCQFQCDGIIFQILNHLGKRNQLVQIEVFSQRDPIDAQCM